jgi:MSHA biogenesis protein MshQ
LSLDGSIDKMFYDVLPGDAVTGEFTLALWLKNRRSDWYSAFFGTRSPVEGGFDAKIDRHLQRIYTDIGDDRSLRSIYSTPESVPLDEWHHVAIAVRPGLQRVYVDGALFDTHEFAADFTPVLFDANHDIAIGAIHGNSNDEDFLGLIDDVRIFSRALTLQEVQRVMNVPELGTATLLWITVAIAGALPKRLFRRLR